MALTDYHGYFEDSVRWRLTRDGVEIENSGIERTKGAPATVTRVWQNFGDVINETAKTYRVPCVLIIATVCTETAGNPDAVREEPGYTSDAATPHRISAGLMQTLISTARDAMQNQNIDRAYLLKPAGSLAAGTAYISQQARITQLDPPLVAAAYNAGKLARQDGSANRWKLRQYRIGTGEHCDRFVRFFNDAVFVLASHSLRPTVPYENLLGTEPPKPRTYVERKQPAAVEIRFATNARSESVTSYSMGVLKEIVAAAGLKSALISSTSRTPADQARIMYNNLEKYGVEHQKRLYGRSGDSVIDVYAKSRAAGKTSDQIKADMETKIKEVGPTNVSRHTGDPNVLNVFDVAPSSITDKVAFEKAVKADTRVTKFLTPPQDPGYHLEIPQPKPQ
ncbi:MAG: transglycosylase SLT domain-containing protein [Anaerolineae bacterium]|nr:transglycosylase SLT domain-containing protein [Anaerolineae bacterium]